MRRSIAAAADADSILQLRDARHANTISYDLNVLRAKMLIVWTKSDLVAADDGASRLENPPEK